MAARIAWVLNLDADLELASGARYEPRRSTLVAMQPHIERLAASLLGPDDVLVDYLARLRAPPSAAVRGLPGRAFCPTPRAISILQHAGAIPEPHPPIDILRRVNSRAFASSLGPTLPGAAFVTEHDDALAMLGRAPPSGGCWRVKYAFGMAGRNQRVIAAASRDPRDGAFVRAGMARGGLQIEPNVAIDEEFAIHGILREDGSLRLGSLVRQRCDRHGAWLSTEPFEPGRSTKGELRSRMVAEAHGVAQALFEAGFFGPFGIDAFLYRDGHGESRLQPRSEINARYGMGFAVGRVLG